MQRFQSLVVRCLLCTALLFTLSYPASAAETSLVEGAWAMQFSIERLLEIGAFEGQTLSIKKHTSDNRAWRLGLDISLRNSDSNRRNYSSDTLVSHDDSGNKGLTIGFSLNRLFYSNLWKKAAFFYGLGPGYQNSRSTNEGTSYRSDRSWNRTKTTNHSWVVSLNLVAGVEWFASEDVSFHAEYGSKLLYSELSREVLRTRQFGDGSIQRSNSTSSNFTTRFGAMAVKFGLSVYF